MAGNFGQGYPYSFYPDEEANVARSVVFYNPSSGLDLNPHWFNKPALGYYINFGEFGFYYLYGRYIGDLWESPAAFAHSFMNERGPFYAIGRTSATLFGILTVWMTYFLGRRFFNRRTGVVAAAVLAMVPGHVIWSQVVKHDVPATFFAAWALLICARISERDRYRDYIITGVLIGVGVALKYYPVVMMAPLLVAHFLRPGRTSALRGLRQLAAAVGAMLAAFFVGSPYNFLDGTFFRGRVMGVFEHAKGMLGFGAGDVDPDKVTILDQLLGAMSTFSDGQGLTPALTALVVVGFIAGRQGALRGAPLMVLSVFVTMFFSLAVLDEQLPRANHVVILYPFAAIFAARGLIRVASASRRPRALAFLTAAVLLIPLPGFPGWGVANRLIDCHRTPSQLEVYEWLQANVEAGTTIVNDDEALPLRMDDERLDWVLERLDAEIAEADRQLKKRGEEEAGAAEIRHFEERKLRYLRYRTKYSLIQQASPSFTGRRYDVIIFFKPWQTEVADKVEVHTGGYNDMWPRITPPMHPAGSQFVERLRLEPTWPEKPPANQRSWWKPIVRRGHPADFLVTKRTHYMNYRAEGHDVDGEQKAHDKRTLDPEWAAFYEELLEHHDCWEFNSDRSRPGPTIRIFDLRKRVTGRKPAVIVVNEG